MGIKENIALVKETIAAAAQRANRDPHEIKLVAVTKNHTVDEIQDILNAGHRVLGENRLQEARPKIEQLPPDIEWHFIGYLQSNKAKQVIQQFTMIHSLDRISLAEALHKESEKRNKQIDCLVEVNIAGEETKSGISPSGVVDLINAVSSHYDRVRIRGLMTMAPYLNDPEGTRPIFRSLRQLRDDIARLHLPRVSMEHLSMGMTNDYPVAVEEGATIVRIGTAIFA